MFFGRRPRRPQRIGIWGLTGAGKTTYLAALWAKCAFQDSTWTLRSENEAAEEFTKRNALKLQKGRFPPGTDPNADPSKYDFTLEHSPPKGRRREYSISLIDAAGKHVLDENDSYGFFATLQECSGLLLMIDRAPLDQEQAEQGHVWPIMLLTQNIYRFYRDNNRLTRDGKVPINIAFCLTKFDLGKTPHNRENPSRIIKEVIEGDGIPGPLKWFKEHFTATCDFGISSVGARKTPSGGYIPNMDFEFIADTDERRLYIPDLVNWDPVCLLEPLMWLMDPTESNCGC